MNFSISATNQSNVHFNCLMDNYVGFCDTDNATIFNESKLLAAFSEALKL